MKDPGWSPVTGTPGTRRGLISGQILSVGVTDTYRGRLASARMLWTGTILPQGGRTSPHNDHDKGEESSAYLVGCLWL